MNERDLVEKHLDKLYASSRGALYSNSLVQAQAAFKDGDFAKTLELVKASRELYRNRHKRTLDLDPKKPDGKRKASKRETLSIEKKQSKIKRMLEVFDDVSGRLDKMARLRELGRPRPDAEPDTSDKDLSPTALPDDFQRDFEAAPTAESRYATARNYFHFETVGSDEDLRPGTLYFLRSKEGYLIELAEADPETDMVPITVVPSGQRMKPVLKRKLLDIARQAKLLRLVPKSPDEIAEQQRGVTADDSGPSVPRRPQKSHGELLVDMGTFTQLFITARQSGIVPDVDQIAHVRDREFRMGKYQQAFEMIERMHAKFTQAVTQRQEQLRTDELNHQSGKLKMTPKEWQAKRRREANQTQRIDRARHSFARVLGGLRVLITSKE